MKFSLIISLLGKAAHEDLIRINYIKGVHDLPREDSR